jgi:hypothetical protein
MCWMLCLHAQVRRLSHSIALVCPANPISLPTSICITTISVPVPLGQKRPPSSPALNTAVLLAPVASDQLQSSQVATFPPNPPTLHMVSPPSSPHLPAVRTMSLTPLASNLTVLPASTASNRVQQPLGALAPLVSIPPHNTTPQPQLCVPAIGPFPRDLTASITAPPTALFTLDCTHFHQLARSPSRPQSISPLSQYHKAHVPLDPQHPSRPLASNASTLTALITSNHPPLPQVALPPQIAPAPHAAALPCLPHVLKECSDGHWHGEGCGIRKLRG